LVTIEYKKTSDGEDPWRRNINVLT